MDRVEEKRDNEPKDVENRKIKKKTKNEEIIQNEQNSPLLDLEDSLKHPKLKNLNNFFV